MQTRKNPKKRRLEQNPHPSEKQKRVKKRSEEENSQIESIIQSHQIESSKNPPIEASSQEIKSFENLTITNLNPQIEASSEGQSQFENPTITDLNPAIETSPEEERLQFENFTINDLKNGQQIHDIDFIKKINIPSFISSTERKSDINAYEHLRQMSAKPYELSFENSEWISPRMVRYPNLSVERYTLVDGQIYLQKSKTMEELLGNNFENSDYTDATKTCFLRGHSGNGKSHGLIQTVLKYRKKQNVRILHMILDKPYIVSPQIYFLYDFFYCFYKDLEDPDFPNPPIMNNFEYDEKISKGENWYYFLSKSTLKDADFLQEISYYLQSKKIAFILIWDQDNIFQKQKKEPSLVFLSSLRESNLFNLVIISASNNNEGFKVINGKDLNIIEQNIGFSLEETKEFLTNVLGKLIGYPINVNNDFLQALYKLTNGNGYYLSMFIQSEGNSLQEKLIKFTEKMTLMIEANIESFFNDTLQEIVYQIWVKKFPEILLYLDTEKIFPNCLFKYQDRNYTYIEDSKLKSVNNFSKEIFLNVYRKQIKKSNQSTNLLSLLSKDIARTNPSFKGILYEHYVIQKLLEELNLKKNFPYYLKISKKTENIECKIHANEVSLILLNEEIEQIIIKKQMGCLIKPFKFNHPVFDLVLWDEEKKFIYFMLITIDKNHSSVDEKFFKEKQYEFLRNKKNAKGIRFIWITNYPEFESKFTDENDRIGYMTITI